MEKLCLFCKQRYLRNKNYNDKQWSKTKFCSSKCFGLSRIGYKHTIETREKLRVSHIGLKCPNAGRYKHSEEHNKKVGEALRKFYKEHPEVGRRIGDKLKGRKVSENSIQKSLATFSQNPKFKGGKKTYRERRCLYERIRKSKKRTNGGILSPDDWNKIKKTYFFTCPSCLKKEPEIQLTIDHILPVKSGGRSEIDNIQPLCKSCNSSKHTKEIRYPFPHDPNKPSGVN